MTWWLWVNRGGKDVSGRGENVQDGSFVANNLNQTCFDCEREWREKGVLTQGPVRLPVAVKLTKGRGGWGDNFPC